MTQAGISIWNEDNYDYHPLLRYYFTTGEEANYTGLAHLYGDYLDMKYETTLKDDLKMSLYLDILGSYDFEDYFLFFPYKRVEALTTYHRAQKMIESLTDQGISSFVVNYQGWFNSGLEHERPNNINLDRSVGSKKELLNFDKWMEDQGHDLFYDVDFVKLYDKKSTYSNSNIARIVGGTMMQYYPYDLASGLPIETEDPYYLLKPSAISQNINSFLKDYQKLDLSGLTLRNLGDQLYSDFHRDNSLYRYETRDIVMDILQTIKQETRIMLTNANAYSLGFADHIIDLPYQSSHFLVLDYAIPFYQIAIAGKISYSMPSINIKQGEIDAYYLLKALETGSNLKFTISSEDTSQLINTRFNTYFSTEYALIEEKIVSLYEELYALIGDNNYLVNHTYVSDSEIRVSYVKGQTILLNYQTLTYTVE